MFLSVLMLNCSLWFSPFPSESTPLLLLLPTCRHSGNSGLRAAGLWSGSGAAVEAPHSLLPPSLGWWCLRQLHCWCCWSGLVLGQGWKRDRRKVKGGGGKKEQRCKSEKCKARRAGNVESTWHGMETYWWLNQTLININTDNGKSRTSQHVHLNTMHTSCYLLLYPEAKAGIECSCCGWKHLFVRISSI